MIANFDRVNSIHPNYMKLRMKKKQSPLKMMMIINLTKKAKLHITLKNKKLMHLI